MKLEWFSATRDEAVAALQGTFSPLERMNRKPSPNLSRDINLAYGATAESPDAKIAVVLLGSERREFFSWLSTYAEDIFPVSINSRVLLQQDWEQLSLGTIICNSTPECSNIWSSIVLGEMLGQSGGDVEVASIPIGRASACYSYTMARSEALYKGSQFARSEVLQRMQKAGRDHRFGQRAISVEMLSRSWAIPQQLQHVSASFDSLMQVTEAVSGDAFFALKRCAHLFSDSAEDRVVGFDTIADDLFAKRVANSQAKESGAIALAAAALLAGRGTSHIQLLAPAARDFPEVLVWFGLLAGVLGARYWDVPWTRGVKSIDRLLRRPFRLDEPVQADLCWPEFEWLTETFSSPETYTVLPKNAPRSLTVELLPGVECQFRFSAQSLAPALASSPLEAPVRPPPHLIDEAIKHLAAVQRLLLEHSSPTAQEDLFGRQSVTLPVQSRLKSSGAAKKGKR